MKVYDYGVFFEDGHKEGFYLKYGPDEDEGEDRLIDKYRGNEYMERFNKETDGFAFQALDALDKQHSFGFILVNPPREMEEPDEE